MASGPILPKQKVDLDLSLQSDARINQKDILQKPFSVSLGDIDTVILYYFQEVIKPLIVVDGKVQPVPIVFANPERWKSIKKDRVYRDDDGKIQTPIITLKRNNIDINRDYGGKMDSNFPYQFKQFIVKYNRFKKYNRFDIVNNIRPSYEVQNVIIPDYLDITYECVIWTEYLEQMNKVLESVIYSENSYWGNEQFKFKTKINSISDSTQVGVSDERNIMSNFGLLLKGYIVPSTINQYQVANPVGYTKSLLQVTFTEKDSIQPTQPVNPLDLVNNIAEANEKKDKFKNVNNSPLGTGIATL